MKIKGFDKNLQCRGMQFEAVKNRDSIWEYRKWTTEK